MANPLKKDSTKLINNFKNNSVHTHTNSNNFFVTSTLNDKSHILSQREDTINNESDHPTLQILQGINKIFVLLVTCPAKIVSFPILNAKGFFRCHIAKGTSGKLLMEHVADEMDSIGIGRMEIISVQGNNSKV